MSSDIKTVELTIAIPFRYLGDPGKAIHRRLNERINHYMPEVDGILIKWEDLVILNDKGTIIDDQPYVFWKVGFTAHVFRIEEGKLVRGKVHRLLKNYFVAKALNSFTVTVSIPDDRLNDKTIQKLMVEQEVYFRIKGTTEGAYRGELDEECLKLTKDLIKEDANREVYDYAKDFEY